MRACFVFPETGLVAQTTNGVISGTVTDPTSAAIAGATVQVKNTGTGVVRTVTTNDQGRYRVPDLLVGQYEVQASQSGFQTVVERAIPLNVGSERVVDLQLPVGQAQQTVSVEGQVAQVDTTSAAMASLVEPKQISDLPLNGRNYTQLIALAPGVQQTPPQFIANGFYGRGADYSVSGGRPEGQAFLLDNSNVQDFWNHGPGSAVLGTTLGVEAIAEFSTQTNTYSAQFGGAGAAINAVTKSGTNSFHGSLFEYFRNSDLDARAFYDPAQLPAFRRNQFGGSVGGPIKKDKAFFFFNYEGLRNRQGLTEIAYVPDANARQGILPGLPPITISPQIQTLLGYYPMPTTLIGGGVGQYQSVATQVGNEDYLLGRVDYTLSAKDSLFIRFVNDRAVFTDPFSGSAITLWPETHHTGNDYATIEERPIVSSNVVNLLRGTFVRTREGSDLNNNETGLSFYPGRKNGTLGFTNLILSPLGSSIFLPFLFVQNKIGGGDDLYWNHGAHSLRFGADVQRVQSNVNAPGWLGGEYEFSSLAGFLSASPFLFFGPLPSESDGYRDFREIDANGYVQDD
ncbi:MAG TPA: carboxypeptidase-like regulatory domain-containing protein [Bryobacteraceae bacterium]|nr:carboxypeptidase-like regulatory domain-containing protein [Bryobacteraceae bacterium]